MSSEEEQKKQLYNRQEYVIGAEAQAKYGATTVLVVGASGLGAEIIKNLVLTGVKAVRILDSTPIHETDLSTNFFLKPEDIGKPRGAVVAAAAKDLNRFVDVSAVAAAAVRPDAETAAVLAALPTVQVVVYVNHTTCTLTAVNTACRSLGVKFVACESRGIAGCIFVDAGDSFDVLDANGEDTVSCVLTGISADGLVMLHDDKSHECEAASLVYFTGITSPATANSEDPAAAAGEAPKKPRLFEVADVTSPHILRIKGLDALAGGGAVTLGPSAYMHTTKKGAKMHFCSLAESLTSPECVMIFDSEEKLAAPATLHAVFRAVAEALGGVAPRTMEEVAAVVAAAKATMAANGGGDDLDEGLAVKVLAFYAGDLNPMSCFIGGMAAQEVLKVCSGKFTPIHQWLYYDAREILAERDGTPAEWLADAQALMSRDTTTAAMSSPGRRYAGQMAVLGRGFQSYLATQSAFIVGAGALGCEFVKNVALMGVGTASITDMDQIEMSNLSRQFLFRSHHIGRAKSTVAAEASRAINPALRVTSYEEKMAPETEGLFNEHFWEKHAVIINALDNIASRKYVDSRCLFYKRPLFESGTLGTKCNMQVVVPYVTESYGNSNDPPEKSIPLCTLKNFPNSVEHTIQWARDQFHLLFSSTPEDVNGYLSDPAAFSEALQRDPAGAPVVLKNVNDALRDWPRDEADCVRLARLMFHSFFNDSFKLLLHNIPLDRRNDDGQLFWSGAKRPPVPQDFSPANPRAAEFVYHTAALLAGIYGLPGPFAMSPVAAAALAAAVPPPAFVPKHAVFATKQTDKEDRGTAAAAGTLTVADLPPVAEFAGRRMRAAEFEKDDPTNHHIDYITHCSNARAEAYGIPPADLVQTKRIAGNIIPAMVTTTSLVTGLVGFEVLKYLLYTYNRLKGNPAACGPDGVPTAVAPPPPVNAKEIATLLGYYRNSFVNMALPLLALSDPSVAPGKTYTRPDGKGELHWGVWDRIDVNEGRDITVNELVARMEERFSLEVFMLTLTSGKIMYSQFGGKAKDKEKPVSVLAAEKGEVLQDGEDYLNFVPTGTIGDETDDVDVPLVRYKFRNF